MSLESSIHQLVAAITKLTNVISGPAAEIHTSPPCEGVGEVKSFPLATPMTETPTREMVIINMDDAGVPSKFKLRCSICGELGRNSRTCQPTPDGSGSYHWKVTQE